MLDFLVAWAEQLTIALIVIVIIEIVLPSQSNYKKYIKVILGIFLLYTIISPLISKSISNIKFKEISANIYYENNIKEQNIIDYDEQIITNFKTQFEQNLKVFLSDNGYELKEINQELEYQDEQIDIKKLEIKIDKKTQEGQISKIEINKKEKISSQELDQIKKKISENYEIDENIITIESENNYD